MQYSAYDTYLSVGDKPTGYSLSKLAIAPFRWDNIKSPLVWIPSVVAPAALIGFYLAVEPDLGTPVYKTGQSHIGTAQVDPVVGGISAAGFGFAYSLSTSIGEEAYYRGIIYNETRRAFGVWPARAIDMIFFPALHLPTDISAGLKKETILFNFGWRSVMTLIFDAANDKGGIPLAVAVHFWSDFILIMARWLFYNG
jgi:membrane protease YdiL (CAAX protease family)